MLKELKTSRIIQLIFAVSIALSAITTYAIDSYKHQQQRSAIQNLSRSYVNLIETNINQALSATFPLAALVQNQHLDEASFTRFATEMLPFYPGVSALQLAPNGIVQYIAPLAGNEKAIGHNLLTSPSRSKEAFAAWDSGKLTLAGPFHLVQGGYGAVGRLPIYLDRPSDEQSFWGFVTVLIRFPQVLDAVKLPALVEAGVAYQLSRINPDTGQIQVLSNSSAPLLVNPVANSIEIANVTWMLKMSPINGWVHYISLLAMSLLSMTFTILTTF
ncbi:MAG: CHASE domain-containing protein, partial [Moritella sp.]|nr:CHASE domain-containing protein [Moritella sp.]